MSKKDAQSEYVTTTELAALCGVSRFTIINWTEQGVINCVKTVGGHRRILRSEALKIIKTLRGNGKQSPVDSKDSGTAAPEPEQEVPEARALPAIAESRGTPIPDKQLLKDVSYVMGRGLGEIKAGLSQLRTNLGGNGRGDLFLP